MTSDRIQRRIERILDQIEAAEAAGDWSLVETLAKDTLDLDETNREALAYLRAAERRRTDAPAPSSDVEHAAAAYQPASFANSRYSVKRFLGEGGKKKVYLAHDAQLDRDVAFALIKTEGLDDVGRERVTREAQAMGRLGDHPNLMTVYDIGDEGGQPYVVLPVMPGGDVEGLIAQAPEHKLPLEQAVKLAVETAQGLEAAHARGIVHRDIKPGNVWLAEDGRAKVGDFGLAVAVDRTRLTQAGMMVGTVNYMPPEQAMGGEITPRSDLYSLGAMLYEMVCGRPPFVGDEAVAIIGQHLNTPPVAPSWHRPDCPPALEVLILRLLEKDPAKRPAGAREVIEALQAAEQPGNRATTVAEPLPATPDPLYRTVFVGRENEVRQLHAAFDAAMSGQGGLVMVVGEPGIGKTALCEHLATYVALRGGRTLVGHCYEEGSLSLPYLAFVEAMRTYVLARDPDGLRSDLGTAAADVALIVSEVRDRVQNVELRPAGDPEDDRWRLLQSVTSFLRSAASVQPLAIVLEDLQWADRGTLDLLLHVARNLQGARLLVAGTYRDVEVDRAHPLSGTLAELRRASNFLRIPLRGLTVDEVHRMYEQIRGHDVPWGQAELVHRQTEGNPLFVQEVLRYLVEEGIVVREEGRYVARTPGEGVPEGLRDVVGKRLSRLTERANAALSIASVIGRDFRLDVLQRVAGTPEEELEAALEEAQERAVIEPRVADGAIAFRFTHAFFRQTLYEEIFAPRRIRLHQQVGRALEAVHARRLGEHAAELAEHFAQSTETADLEKAVRYGELAAKRAMSVFAYGEAERHLEQALRAQEVLDPEDNISRCDLLLALAEALGPAGQPHRAVTTCDEAYLLAEAQKDDDRASRACRLAGFSGVRSGGGAWSDEWVRRSDRHGRDGTVDRVNADIALAVFHEGGGDFSRARNYLHRALALAQELGDKQSAHRAATWIIFLGNETERLRLAQEFLAESRNGVSSFTQSGVMWGAGLVLRAHARMREAEELWREHEQLAGRTHDPVIVIQALVGACTRSIFEGRLEEAAAISAQQVPTAERSGGYYINQAARLLALLGPSSEWITLTQVRDRIPDSPELQEIFRMAGSDPHSDEVRMYSFLLDHPTARFTPGRDEGARYYLERARLKERPYEISHITATRLLEAAVLAGALDLLPDLIDRVRPFAGHLLAVVGGRSSDVVCPARLLGEASALLHESDSALAFYGQGLQVAEAAGHRPEFALIRLGLAELLLENYPDQRHAAIEHLNFAIGEFREMKMQPALERALRHRGLLKA